MILSTYEAPDLLEKSLCGFATQEYREFDIVIADDGSGPGTRERIER
ncbi:MAG: glycosyltransferase, partial [Vicinamibacteria bacterium]